MSVITIVGSGVMGSALSFPSTENGHTVRLVGTHLDRDIIESVKRTGEHPTLHRRIPDGVEAYQIEELSAALSGADLVICGVSSFGVRWFAGNVLPLIPEETPVLSVTKGLYDAEDGALLPFPRAYELMLPGRRMNLNAIGGPCICYELTDHRHTTVTFCGGDMSTLKKLKTMLARPYYHITLSTDVAGIECSVAMKNCYAMCTALAAGLREKEQSGLYYNAEAALFGQAVRETLRLVKLMGGDPESIAHGIGDLYVTLMGGRSRKLGMLLGEGLNIDEAREKLSGMTLEASEVAVTAARGVKKLAASGKARCEDFPLLMHVYSVLTEKTPVDIPWAAFEETVED